MEELILTISDPYHTGVFVDCSASSSELKDESEKIEREGQC